jgi:transcriptional regulator with XRE-family HTH domain
MEATMNPPRLLTAEELALLVRVSRESRKWSQEQLAAISGLSTRTVQRVENAKPSDLDTRRALARAFELEDIDAFNKPFKVPTEDELREAQAKFEREHVTLTAMPLTGGGRQLATLVAQHSVDMCTPGFELAREAEEVFARLVDYLREFRECEDLYSEVDKLGVYDEAQSYVDQLHDLGVSLRFAERHVALKVNPAPDAAPFKTSILYLVAFRVGHEPSEFVTPRQVKLF